MELKKMVIIFSLLFSMLLPQLCNADGATATPNPIRRSVATVMFAGLSGAVLGLSTLSFYGEPQEHINNIWIGLALGTMAGGVYVLNQSRASSTYAEQWPQNPHQVKNSTPTLMAYQFEF